LMPTFSSKDPQQSDFFKIIFAKFAGFLFEWGMGGTCYKKYESDR
jgi:hypothetical protein